VPQTPTADTSGSHGTTPPSLSTTNATADAGEVGSEMIGEYVPALSQSPADATADAGQVGSEMIGDYVPAPPQSSADATADANVVGSEMIGEYVPTTAPNGPLGGRGPGQR
jgi:hypothetical protein